MYLIIKQTSDKSCGYCIEEFSNEKEAKDFINKQDFQKCFRLVKVN